jgi:hypothetical protein
MINYPTGSWETDLKIPGNFVRDYTELTENILNIDDQDNDLRYFKNERYYILWEYAKSVTDLNGDFVECGVSNGNSAFFMAKHCKTHLHLFDSFEGATDFTEHDNDYYRENTFAGSANAVNTALAGFDNVTLHIGEVPFEFDQLGEISLLHVDLNNYNPTKTTLEALWEKVVPGGVVIVDFHDSVSTGAEKATLDFFQGHPMTIMATGKAVIINE